MPGLALCERYYEHVVRPLLARHVPALAHSAARIDEGSDVLGFDDATSMDHGWGPRLLLFVAEGEFARVRDPLLRALAAEIPPEFDGHSTDAGDFARPVADDTAHGVTVTTARRFFRGTLGLDPFGEITTREWLAAPPNRLRALASGRVYHDGLGELGPARERLRWYPRDLWLYLLAAQWRRVGQEEAFMARCGTTGDELGSRVVAARQVVELMRLCFLLERQHVAYFKWFGHAFARLEAAADVGPPLGRALAADEWRSRERALGEAYLAVARRHDALGVTPPVDARLLPFHGRPFTVLDADRFAAATEAAIADRAVRALPAGVGAVWQFADSTDVLYDVRRTHALTAVYEP